jgi:hypothetical protein
LQREEHPSLTPANICCRNSVILVSKKEPALFIF